MENNVNNVKENNNTMVNKGENNMNKNLQIIKEQEILGKQFRIYGSYENPLFLAKDVAEWIEHSNSRMMLQSIDEDEKVKINNPYILKGGQQEQWFLTESGVVELIAKSRKATKEKKLELLKELNISDKNSNLIISYKEIEFINKLEKVLFPLNLKLEKQYNVLDYRLDGYIPKLNIAIEYDENDHKDYTYEKQELRQEKIEEELNCKFIRLSDRNDDEYNIGLVIKEIMGVR